MRQCLFAEFVHSFVVDVLKWSGREKITAKNLAFLVDFFGCFLFHSTTQCGSPFRRPLTNERNASNKNGKKALFYCFICTSFCSAGYVCMFFFFFLYVFVFSPFFIHLHIALSIFSAHNKRIAIKICNRLLISIYTRFITSLI